LQGDIERQRGLKVSPFMDREESSMAKMSCGFIDFFVKNMYSQLQRVLPPVEECCNRIADTRNRWAQLLDNPEEKKSS